MSRVVVRRVDEYTAKSNFAKILPLTSIRFFAALYVVVFHVAAFIPYVRNSKFLTRFFALGYVSVSFFFVLSGFVLAMAYLSQNRAIDRRRFFLARFARLYPLIVAAMLLDLPHLIYTETHLFHHGAAHYIAVFLNSFAVLAAWFPSLGSLDQPVWSVSAEIFFYALFPWIGKFIWKINQRATVAFAIAVYFIGNICMWYLPRVITDEQFLLSNPVLHLNEFVLGICTARLFLFLNQNPARQSAFTRMASWMLPAAIALFLAIPVFGLPLSRHFLEHGLLFPIYAVVILSVSMAQKTLRAILSMKGLVVLGEASFALYLIHLPLSSLFRTAFTKYGMPAIAAYFALSIGLSVASFYWLETPARKWIMNHFQEKKEGPITVALAQ